MIPWWDMTVDNLLDSLLGEVAFEILLVLHVYIIHFLHHGADLHNFRSYDGVKDSARVFIYR